MPTMLKRPAAAAAAPAAKKHKQVGRPAGSAKATKETEGAKLAKEAKAPPAPKRDPLLVKVATGLSLMTDVPEAAKAMLDDALEDSLGTPKEERHPYQAAMVDMIEDTLGSVEKGLQASLDSVRESIARIDETKASAASTVEEHQKKLEEQRSKVSTRKYDLADIATAFKAARQAVADAKLAQEEADRSLQRAAGDKQELEMALTGKEHLEMALSQEKIDKLVSVLKRFSFDESMTSALPSALLKEPNTRGPFDTMVLSQLEAEVTKRIASINAVLVEAEPAKAERAANVEKAEATFAEAKAKQLQSARVFEGARTEEQRCQDEVQEAKKAVSDAGKEARQLHKESDKCQRALDRFREGPQAAFLQLRDRSAPAPPAAEEEAGAPASGVADQASAASGGGDVEQVAEQEEVIAMGE